MKVVLLDYKSTHVCGGGGETDKYLGKEYNVAFFSKTKCPTILCSWGSSSTWSNTSHTAAGRSSLEGEPLPGVGVVLLSGERREEAKEVNCHISVSRVISRGIPIGFFNTKPTATGSEEWSKIHCVHVYKVKADNQSHHYPTQHCPSKLYQHCNPTIMDPVSWVRR